MIKLELTIQQVEELKNYYIPELERIQKRADEIRGLISKLTAEIGVITEPEKNPLKKNDPDEEKTEKHTKWSNFIVQILKDKQKPLSRLAILKLCRQHYNVKITNSKNAISSLAQALFVLRTKKNLVQSIKMAGKNERLYALTEWGDKYLPKAKPEKQIKQKKSTLLIEETPLADSVYNWPKFIVDILNKTKRVLSAKEFLNYAIVNFGIPKNDVSSARNSLIPTLSHLSRKAKTLKTTKKEGRAGRSYGLKQWFGDGGQLIPDFK